MSKHEEKSGGQPAVYALPYQYFFIQSDLNGLVLEVANGNTSGGTPVYAFSKSDPAVSKQKWREDPHTQTIRTALNDFCLDVDGSQLHIDPYKPCNASQKWLYTDNAISSSNCGLALEITGDQSGAKVIVAAKNGHANQSWTFVPVK